MGPFWEGSRSLLLVIFVALGVRWSLVEVYEIPSSSMIPTLLIHDHIFVNKLAYGVRVPFTEKWILDFGDPHRGEVVVFKHPQNKDLFYVKRVVGLQGDRIFYENGNLYINDALVQKSIPEGEHSGWLATRDQDFPGESFQGGGKAQYVHWEENLDQHRYSIILRKGEKTGLGFGPYVVPPGHFFVMGDNRDNSQDSRGWSGEASRAHGTVTFTVQEGQVDEIKIPAGTLVKTDQPGVWTQKFKTVHDMVLRGGRPVDVNILAVEPGWAGNVVAGAVRVIEGPLAHQLKVKNALELRGGDDKRFIPREFLVGRATWVWLSCEKKLPVLSFLCHPFYIRWGRFLQKIK